MAKKITLKVKFDSREKADKFLKDAVEYISENCYAYTGSGGTVANKANVLMLASGTIVASSEDEKWGWENDYELTEGVDFRGRDIAEVIEMFDDAYVVMLPGMIEFA